MKEFLRFRLWDWLLCAAIAVGLVYHFFSGFYLDDAMYNSVLYVVLFLAAAMAVMVLFSYTRLLTGIGAAVGIVLLLLVVSYTHSHDVFGTEASETTNSLFITLTVTVLTGVLVYLACRSRAGIIVLFLAGNILICGSYFLKFPVEIWCFLLFTFGCFVMFWYRNYMITITRSQTGKIRLPRYMVQTLLICLVSICVGGGIYYGIVRPIHPPTRELKLIEVLKHNEVVKMSGVYSVNESLNPDQTSSKAPDASDWGNDNADEEKGTEDRGAVPEDNSENEAASGQQKQQQETTGIYYLLKRYIKLPWLIICLAVAAALLVLLRIWTLRRQKAQLAALGREDQMVNYYRRIYRGLQSAGFKKPCHYTLYEYAEQMEHTMETFSVGEATFGKLTDIYVQILYGRHGATEEEWGWFRSFYENFRRALRKEIGIARYLIRGFWLR